MKPNRAILAGRSGRLKRRVSRFITKSVQAAAPAHTAVYCGDHVVLTRIHNGRRVFVDMRDSSVGARIALGELYEPHVAKVLAAAASPGDVFFDVGANVGYHSVLLWPSLKDSGGQMHLFEPNPDVFALLRRTMNVNGFWNGVFSNQLALSDGSKESTLTVYEDLWGSARLQPPDMLSSSNNPWAAGAQPSFTYTVPTTTVDSYCEGRGVTRIDLMKIDTEGHEEAVLAGMATTIAGSPRLRIVLEFTFGAYSDPEAFWGSITSWFPYRYAITQDGALLEVSSLGDLRSVTTAELADILVSKIPVSMS